MKLQPFNNRDELLWASGLFEGEGWISIQGRTPSIGMQMSDKEVLERFSNAVGGGPIYYRKPRTYSYEKIHTRKEQWAWRVNGFQNVQAIIALLWNGLSRRRKARAKEVLAVARMGQPKCGNKRGAKLKDNPHGHVRRYWQGCRCDDCAKAAREYAQNLWKRRRAYYPRINRKYTRKTN